MAREQCQTTAYVLFIFRVDVSRFSDVIDDGNAGAAERGGLHLTFLHTHPMAVFRGVAEVGELNPEERKVALAECLAPVLYEGSERLAVDVALAASGFSLALVPDCAFNGVLHERGNHSVG